MNPLKNNIIINEYETDKAKSRHDSKHQASQRRRAHRRNRSREVFNSPVSHLNLRFSVAICRNTQKNGYT